jgi:hypothetical protein
MDLRGKITQEQVERACGVLNYQPFILTDELQTGAAYSWMWGVEVKTPRLLFKKQEVDIEEWSRITDANERLRKMYDAFITEIANRYPRGSLLDFACNNGYFPVKASQLGMRGTVGIDVATYFSKSIDLLNEILGTDAQFASALYDPRTKTAPVSGKYSVVCASAILCHVPDPLDFLAFLGSLASEAVFFFGQVIDTDELIVSYQKPDPILALRDLEVRFPYRYNDNTRLSRGLLYNAFEDMGFKEIVEFPWRSEWLPPYFDMRMREPVLEGEARPEVCQAWKLASELRRGSKHMAVLAMR